MSRPHEDLQRHQAVDHRPGGLPASFAPGAWYAIAIGHVKADRNQAAVSSYETLVEKARHSSAKAHSAIVLRSADGRRVVAMIQLDGHEAFRHLQTAWREEHQIPDHPAADHRSTLELYQVATATGIFGIDPQSKDAFAIEHIAGDQARAARVVDSITAAPGYRSLVVLNKDDATDNVILYHFAHEAELSAARAGGGDSLFYVRLVKTF